MADFTQTVTNNLPLMAISPAVYWNALTWGTDNWGFEGDIITEVDATIALGTTAFTTAIANEVEHAVGLGTLVLTDVYGREFEITFGESLDLTEDIENIMRSLGIWDYVFTKPTTDAQDQAYDESTRVEDGSTTWTPVSDGSSTWSDV